MKRDCKLAMKQLRHGWLWVLFFFLFFLDFCSTSFFGELCTSILVAWYNCTIADSWKLNEDELVMFSQSQIPAPKRGEIVRQRWNWQHIERLYKVSLCYYKCSCHLKRFPVGAYIRSYYSNSS
jgi:hypothetical protein